MTRFGMLLTGLTSSILLSCRSEHTCEVIACVTNLELPSMTDGIERSWFDGKSEAVVTSDFEISSDGRATNVDTRSPTPELANFVSKHLDLSTFNTTCEGRRVKLRFELSFVELPVAMHLPAVSVRANNTIAIKFAARGPSPPLRSTERN